MDGGASASLVAAARPATSEGGAHRSVEARERLVEDAPRREEALGRAVHRRVGGLVGGGEGERRLGRDRVDQRGWW